MSTKANDQAREAWNTNASFWDRRMADGNDFFNVLLWPSVERLLRPRPGELFLDVACGNGVTSRRMARAGARVVGIDFAGEMIRLARERDVAGEVEYRVIRVGEVEDREGAIVTAFSVKVSTYLTPYTQLGLAMVGQPVPHPCFHRPLGVLLGDAFAAGFVLDALDERSFPADDSGGPGPLSWDGRFSEIPAAMIGRLRPSTG